jgi:lipopolysaccharide transport system ATP-binding protein
MPGSRKHGKDLQMSSENAIQVTGISKCYQIYRKPMDRLLQMLSGGGKQRYKEFWALQDLSFDIKKGETLGIIGRNGSGKSTLLQILCGTLTPSTGRVQTQGRIAALLELGAGFNPEFSGRENVYLVASLYGLPKVQINERFDDIAAFAEIGDFIDQPVKTYSSGMYVRLAFSVIAHVDADILVIDEALAVGDAFFTQKCMRFIRKFGQEKSLVFVSHDIASVVNLCKKVIWLDKGEVQQIGPAKEVCESYLNQFFEAVGSDQDIDGIEAPQQAPQRIERLDYANIDWHDQRQDVINRSPLRNDLEVYVFDTSGSDGFGGDEAKIAHVMIVDSNGKPLKWIVGGEKVSVQIDVEAKRELVRPIVGFFFKDRLGQALFGDNTYLSYQHAPVKIEAGATLRAKFDFIMPWLPSGDYTVQVAVAEGTQNEHRQLHWVHDALAIRSTHSGVSTGLVGIPMLDIKIEQINRPNE